MNTDPKQPDKTALQNPGSSPANPPAGMLQPSWLPGYPPSDEIDLVDLGVMLWCRRRLMAAVFVVFVILTVVTALLKKPSYDYTTTLQLGNIMSQTTGNVLPLMSAQSAAQTLQASYIPNAMYQYAVQNRLDPSALRLPKITATGDVNGSTVVLSCRARESQGPLCAAVEKIAAETFIKDNSRFVTAAKNQLASLKSQATVLQVQLDKLDTSAKLYQQQQVELQQQIARMQKAGIQAARDAASGSAALSNLILNTEVQKAMDSLSRVQQQLDVSIPQQRAQLLQQIHDNLQAQQLQQQTISQSYLYTLNAGLRSLQPVGLGRAAILAIGIVLSIFLAILASLFATYISQVRARLTVQSGVKS